MTDRLKGVVVTFEKNIREDDAAEIINAIGMVKGVLSVNPLKANLDDHIAQERVRHEIAEKLWKVLYPDLNSPA